MTKAFTDRVLNKFEMGKQISLFVRAAVFSVFIRTVNMLERDLTKEMKTYYLRERDLTKDERIPTVYTQALISDMEWK